MVESHILELVRLDNSTVNSITTYIEKKNEVVDIIYFYLSSDRVIEVKYFVDLKIAYVTLRDRDAFSSILPQKEFPNIEDPKEINELIYRIKYN